MSANRNTLRALRIPPGIALLVLSVLLVCSQIVEVAHADFDCEHESCRLCATSAGDSGLVGEAALTPPPRCERRAEAPASTGILQAAPTRSLSIRGPPAT